MFTIITDPYGFQTMALWDIKVLRDLIQDLLNTTELNLDSKEPHTIHIINRANEVLKLLP